MKGNFLPLISDTDLIFTCWLVETNSRGVERDQNRSWITTDDVYQRLSSAIERKLNSRDLERSNYSTAQQHSNYWEALLFARFGWSQRKKINRSFSFISLFSAHSVNLKRSRSISKMEWQDWKCFSDQRPRFIPSLQYYDFFFKLQHSNVNFTKVKNLSISVLPKFLSIQL